jgi:L-ribulose-5-phosphate 4-epimerase
MHSYKILKEEAWEANQSLWKHGLVLLTFGNVSAMDRKRGAFAIKPSGVPYTELKPEDMVVVDLESRVVEGKLRPSSDTKTHAVLYRNFPSIGGVAHTHSMYATAWAQAVRPIPILGTTHADHLSSDIPCTEVMSDEAVQGDYEEETGLLIVRAFQDRSYEEVQMILVACHGPFAWGRTAEEAVRNSVVLEELARMAFLTLQINPKVSALTQALIDKHYSRKHGRNAYYGQD